MKVSSTSSECNIKHMSEELEYKFETVNLECRSNKQKYKSLVHSRLSYYNIKVTLIRGYPLKHYLMSSL